MNLEAPYGIHHVRHCQLIIADVDDCSPGGARTEVAHVTTIGSQEVHHKILEGNQSPTMRHNNRRHDYGLSSHTVKTQ